MRREPAHPRSRGENHSSLTEGADESGSSPLTRGKPSIARFARFARGLIPAHAGKTKTGLANRKLYRAHPRSRGENQVQVLKAHFGDGSSPLTRGKRPDVKTGSGLPGLIPAHAGKTAISNGQLELA